MRDFLAAIFILAGIAQPFTFTAAPSSQADEVKRRFVGSWKLVKSANFAANGDAFPGDYDVGRLRYDAQGEMDAHLMRSRPHAYLAYFGLYTIDAENGIIVHHIAGSSRRDWIGTHQIRYYGFSSDGNQLTLSLKAGGRVTQTLAWDRMQ